MREDKVLGPAGSVSPSRSGYGFGTMPVFLAAISTILGAIMFLRFGYAVGHTGLIGALGIVLLGHLVTIPTALAIAEIATNRRVEGGGEYFIISRSFGTTIGGVIGISLYLSQAVSVAFYMIAFAEAARPLAPQIEQLTGYVFEPRMVSLPATLLLIVLMLTRGANLGVKALYVVAAVLATSLALFFLGTPVSGFDPSTVKPFGKVPDAHAFFLVFAICFPAFTGMTAGVGLSGDLANPRRSIPLGTLVATLLGMVVYAAIVVKLAYSAPPGALAKDPLIMGKIALWGPIIVIGLGCATLSSAIGSLLIAPRTMQALATDRSLPLGRVNRWLGAGSGETNEPRNATLLTGAVAVVVVFLGNVDFVARLVSVFFMVTYGALCAISFLEHFAARPSYRPSFRSRWWISLFGALMCTFLIVLMDPLYALLAMMTLTGLYVWMVRAREEKQDDLAEMFQGVFSQLTRWLQLHLQRRRAIRRSREWRPSVIMVNDRTHQQRAPLELMRWICHRHGFGTYLHYIQGYLDRSTYRESLRSKHRLLELARKQQSPVYMDTIVSPSMTSALAQSLQVPGVSGLNNNTVLFETSTHDSDAEMTAVVEQALFASATQMSLLVLRHGELQFGERQSIHIWLTWNDHANANLMILLGYILLGHPDWKRAEISVFAASPAGELEQRRQAFAEMTTQGRLPISEQNIRFLALDDLEAYHREVERRSTDADLAILGFDLAGLSERGAAVFRNHASLPATLFVSAAQKISME